MKFPEFRSLRPEAIWLPLVIAAALALYLPSLGNDLVFDDAYLTGGLFNDFAAGFALRARALSYSSFVWLQWLAGEGWWKQRLANVGIHIATVIALWAFYREILRHIAPPSADGAPGEYAPLHRSAALGVAIAFFALNPAAVYSVAYLIQRSILLATFFTVVALWLFARGIARGKPWLHAAALGCYVLAVMSKEYAIMAPLAAVPLYIVVARPAPRRIAALAAAGGVAVGLAGFVLWRYYGEILGKPFDEYSNVYLAQLTSLDPDVAKNAYGLSIENQAWLFFQYGLRWMLPWSGWMSINLRPPFPIAWLTFPQALGVFAYAGVLAAGAWLVLRYRDWRALAGLSVLIPALLFMTEFATVWVQDPFVLYRSYLWAIGIPGLVFCLVYGPSPRLLLAIGVALAALLAWQAFDRIFSMSTPVRAWSDAIAKLPRDPRSVGRWFPYVNRGVAFTETDEFDSAIRDFEASAALGDMGTGSFNKAAVLVATGHPAEALPAFDRAEREGYNLYNLPFQRGLALMALHRPAEAFTQFERTRAMAPPSPVRELVLLQLGRSALESGRHDAAIAHVEALLASEPRNNEARYLRSMGYIAKGEPMRAREILDAWLAEGDNGPALYARAVAHYRLNHRAEALADIEGALHHGLDNPAVRQWKARIEAMR